MTFANTPQNERRRQAPPERITPSQNRKLFALAKEQGKSIDELRDMTPAGSISMLTKFQAANLIDALESGKSVDYSKQSRMRCGTGVSPVNQKRTRRPKGVIALATDAQRNTIEDLRAALGWSDEGLTEFLAKRHYKGTNRPMTEMLTSGDAVARIELLKAVLEKSRNAASRRKENHE